MKKINEASIIKYNDTAFMIIGGITYYVPIATLDTMLPGSGTAITFASGTGKAGEEILKEMKVASKEGIKSEYEAGNISEETYNRYTQIWNMTDEEYMKNVNLAKVNGQITEEEYEQMETIRNMADNWTTKENMNKAMGVSAASGAWEAAQWIVGKNLNGMNTIGGSKVAASLTRVGIDTAFNAADTPFRSLLASGALNKDFVETFNERGGWQGVGVNTGVGLVGSLFGEVQDWRSYRKQIEISEKVTVSSENQSIMSSNEEHFKVDGDTLSREKLKLENEWKYVSIEEFKQEIDVYLNWQKHFNFESMRSKKLKEYLLEAVDKGEIDLSRMVSKRKLFEDFADYDARVCHELFEKNGEIFYTFGGNVKSIYSSSDKFLNLDLSKRPIERIMKNGTYGKLDSWLRQNSIIAGGNNYGANQQVLAEGYFFDIPKVGLLRASCVSGEYRKKYQKIISEDFEKKIEFISAKYNFSYKDAKELACYMDAHGICTYAALANNLVTKYGYDETVFKSKTGVDLYKTIDGEKVLNYEEILIDLEVYLNEENIVKTLPDGTRIYDSSKYEISLAVMDENTGKLTRKTNEIENYLKAKGNTDKYIIEADYILDEKNTPEVVRKIVSSMEQGKAVNLTVAEKDIQGLLMCDLKMYSEKAFDSKVNAGHIMTVTGVNELGLIVDSWGTRYFVSYESLIDNPGFSNIEIVDFVE